MAFNIFNVRTWFNRPNTTTPINNVGLNDLELRINEAFEEVVTVASLNAWAIGTGFIAYDDTDYSNYLGGTWARALQGRSPYGVDPTDTNLNAAGKKYGAKTHSLTSSENGPHSHPIADIVDAAGGANFPAFSGKANGNTGGTPTKGYIANGLNSGLGTPHNNMHPVEAVYFWRRIA